MVRFSIRVHYFDIVKRVLHIDNFFKFYFHQ